MCGLVGMIGPITKSFEEAFKTLLILDVLRGPHSTGVLRVGQFNGDEDVVKQVGNPFELFSDWRYEDMMRMPAKVLMGHNRWATQGKINKANAHPFVFDNITGAHNGTLTQKHQLDKAYKFDVDSQALFNNIDKFGVQDTVDKMSGAWALTWFDSRDSTMNFLRNGERPLYMASTANDEHLVWASEAWMIKQVSERHGLKLSEPGMVVENTLISFPVGDRGVLGKGAVTKIQLPKPLITRVFKGGHTAPRPGPNLRLLDMKKSNTPAPCPKVDLLGTKQREYDVGFKGSDIRGAVFINCEDPKNPDLPFRLFVNKKDKNKYYEGDRITADLSVWQAEDGGYFKLEASSVNIIEIAHYPQSLTEVEDLLKMPTVKDHKGHWISEEKFKEEYPYCSWCTSEIDPLKPHKLFKNGDCLCDVCMTDKEVSEMASLG
jgi:hypothetical protein